MSAGIPRELSAGGESSPALNFLNIFQMSKNKTDSLLEITDSNLQEILLPKKLRVKKDADKDMLATSSAHDSGSESIGEAHKIRPTPPDAHAHVKVNTKGKLQFYKIYCK